MGRASQGSATTPGVVLRARYAATRVACRPWTSASWLICLFQVFVVTSSFQLSGLGHFGRDLAQVITVGHLHHEGRDQDEDEPGHDCPPGCPNCHHVHLSGAALQPAPGPTPSPIASDEASTVR